MSKIYQINNSNFSYVLVVAIIPFLIGSCSSTNATTTTAAETFELLPADEMKPGPGLFSGDKGGFVIVGGDKKSKSVAKNTSSITSPKSTKSVSNMDLQETSNVLDEKIRQLERDQRELEQLKSEVDKKLKN